VTIQSVWARWVRDTAELLTQWAVIKNGNGFTDLPSEVSRAGGVSSLGHPTWRRYYWWDRAEKAATAAELTSIRDKTSRFAVAGADPEEAIRYGWLAYRKWHRLGGAAGFTPPDASPRFADEKTGFTTADYLALTQDQLSSRLAYFPVVDDDTKDAFVVAAEVSIHDARGRGQVAFAPWTFFTVEDEKLGWETRRAILYKAIRCLLATESARDHTRGGRRPINVDQWVLLVSFKPISHLEMKGELAEQLARAMAITPGSPVIGGRSIEFAILAAAWSAATGEQLQPAVWTGSVGVVDPDQVRIGPVDYIRQKQTVRTYLVQHTWYPDTSWPFHTPEKVWSNDSILNVLRNTIDGFDQYREAVTTFVKGQTVESRFKEAKEFLDLGELERYVGHLAEGTTGGPSLRPLTLEWPPPDAKPEGARRVAEWLLHALEEGRMVKRADSPILLLADAESLNGSLDATQALANAANAFMKKHGIEWSIDQTTIESQLRRIVLVLYTRETGGRLWESGLLNGPLRTKLRELEGMGLRNLLWIYSDDHHRWWWDPHRDETVPVLEGLKPASPSASPRTPPTPGSSPATKGPAP
jgi:hypothetical protein